MIVPGILWIRDPYQVVGLQMSLPFGGCRLFAFFPMVSEEQKFSKYTFDDIKCVYC